MLAQRGEASAKSGFESCNRDGKQKRSVCESAAMRAKQNMAERSGSELHIDLCGMTTVLAFRAIWQPASY